MKIRAWCLLLAVVVLSWIVIPGAVAQSPSPSPSDEASPSETSPSPEPSKSPKKDKSNNRDGDKKDKDNNKDGSKNNKGGAKGGDKDRNPPGNNGNIKIEGAEIDDIPNNNPHPGCVFTITFWNYDEGDLHAVAEFYNQPPSGTGLIFERDEIFIGDDEATGGRDLDAHISVDLADALAASGAEAHPKQGFHIKLTVHAEGSIGADVKHKVFWLEECEDDVVLAARAARAAAAAEAAEAGGAPGDDVAAAGVGRGAGVEGSQLPATGQGLALTLFALLGLALIGAGTLFARRGTES